MRKHQLFSVAFVMLSVQLFGQTGQSNAEAAVRQALGNLSDGTYTSTEQKELGWLGDASAVALTKILGGKILEEHDVESALQVITLSYEDPRVVSIEADREPRTTLLLLRYLDLAASNAGAKKKIASTRAFVLRQYAMSTNTARSPGAK
jgi:hypothetical protein